MKEFWLVPLNLKQIKAALEAGDGIPERGEEVEQRSRSGLTTHTRSSGVPGQTSTGKRQGTSSTPELQQERSCANQGLVGETFPTCRVKVTDLAEEAKEDARKATVTFALAPLTNLKAWPDPQPQPAICMVSLPTSIGATLTDARHERIGSGPKIRGCKSGGKRAQGAQVRVKLRLRAEAGKESAAALLRRKEKTQCEPRRHAPQLRDSGCKPWRCGKSYA